MVITDNFGKFLAAHFHILSSGNISVTLDTIAGSSVTVRVYGTSSTAVWNDTDLGSVSDQAQVGQGVTPATRADINIETPFPTSPENSRITSTPGGYNSVLAKITIPTVITPTGSSGTITEACKYNTMIQNTLGPNPQIFLFFRDIVSPGVNFMMAEAINISHEVLI